MVTLMDPNDPQEERVFLALRRLQLPHLRDTLAAVLSEAAKEQWTYTLSGNFMRPLRYMEDCRRS